MESFMSEPAIAAHAADDSNRVLLESARASALSIAARRSFAATLLVSIKASGLSFDDFAAEAGMPPHRLASLTSGRTVPTEAEAFNLWATENWWQWME
jgi:hypothetical protein